MAHAPMAKQYLGSGIWFQRRTTCGAIFLVTVPETMSRSACLGEGRKTSEPKRAMSKRAIDAAIISIAQQASPNCSGQTELLRPQLWSSSMLVSRMPWRRSSSRSASVGAEGEGAGSLISLPFEVPAVPGPHKALCQQQNEGEHHEERPRRQRGEHDREGKEEQQLHVEDQEHDRIQIIMGLELDPRIARRRDPALVSGVLDIARF